MQRDPLAYKYVGPLNGDGTAAEFIPGIPSRDIHRAECDGLPDDEKAALHESPLHRAYGHADEEATEAAERIEKAEAAPEAPAAAAAPAAPEPTVAAPRGSKAH